MSDVVTGKVWKFGDGINTDLMLPNVVNDGHASLQDQARMVFHANRPGWVDEMRPGDVIIGGRSYGVGSNRPAARSLRTLGVGCLIAESINGLFFRNCVNFGMPALECPGIHAAFEEGQVAEISFSDFTVRNRDTGEVLQAQPIPAHLLKLMQSGGVFPLLEREGLISPLKT